MNNVLLGRIHDDIAAGPRVLVDRLWPRGISKERAALSLWAKDIAPSNELRRWLHTDGEFDEFAERYCLELDDNPDLPEFVQALGEFDQVTLLTAAKCPEHSHLSVLRDYLARRRA